MKGLSSLRWRGQSQTRCVRGSDVLLLSYSSDLLINLGRYYEQELPGLGAQIFRDKEMFDYTIKGGQCFRGVLVYAATLELLESKRENPSKEKIQQVPTPDALQFFLFSPPIITLNAFTCLSLPRPPILPPHVSPLPIPSSPLSASPFFLPLFTVDARPEVRYNADYECGVGSGDFTGSIFGQDSFLISVACT
eukprot:1080639-Amorphochlora_amoeboformis.AAC.3